MVFVFGLGWEVNYICAEVLKGNFVLGGGRRVGVRRVGKEKRVVGCGCGLCRGGSTRGVGIYFSGEMPKIASKSLLPYRHTFA